MHVAAHVVADVGTFLVQVPVLDLIGLELPRVPCVAVGERVESAGDPLHVVHQLVQQDRARAQVVLQIERFVDENPFDP